MKARIGQKNAPILDTLLEFVKKNETSFHTPGHKDGTVVENQFRQLILDFFKADLSCSVAALDVLDKPSSIIKDAQDLASELFNARKSFFLINGSTVGILASMLSTLCKNDKVIIPRNSHKSVLSGLILTGASPIYIYPRLSREFNIPLNLTIEEIEEAYNKNKNIKAIIIQNPNIWGIAADIEKIAKFARSKGLVLIIDEAHGCHFQFSDKLPKSASQVDSDIWIQSFHKTLPSLTQTSILHNKSTIIKDEKISESLSLLQSTSANYILLASLDSARRLYARKGKKLVEGSIELADMLRRELANLKSLKILDTKHVSREGQYIDKTKVVVKCLGVVDGLRLNEELIKNNIYCEFYDRNNLLFLINNSKKEDILYLIKKIKLILKNA